MQWRKYMTMALFKLGCVDTWRLFKGAGLRESPRSYSLWHIPTFSVFWLLTALQIAQPAAAQVSSCTATYTCPSGVTACYSLNGGGPVSTRPVPGTFTSAAACTTYVQNANLHSGLSISCSCSGGGSTTGSKTTAPAAPATSGNLTTQQKMALGAAQAAMPYVQQAVHDWFWGTPAPPPDPAVEQRQLAAQQLNNSGIYLFKQRNYAGAINEFEQALAVTPNDANILRNLQMAKQAQKNTATAGRTGDSLGQLLGTTPETAGNMGSNLNLVNLGSDPSVVDLRNATRTSPDPEALKGQLDSVFSNNAPTPAPQVQSAQDIDKLFPSQQPAPSPSQGKVDSLNARCAAVEGGSAADVACQQEMAKQVTAKPEQLDDTAKNPKGLDIPNDLRDSVGDPNAASSSGSGTASNGGQAAPGGSTNFFGSSNAHPTDLTPANSPPTQPVNTGSPVVTNAGAQLKSAAAIAGANGDLSAVYNGGAKYAGALPVPAGSGQARAASQIPLYEQKILDANPQYQQAVAARDQAEKARDNANQQLVVLKANPPSPQNDSDIAKANQQLTGALNAIDTAKRTQNNIIRRTIVLPATGSGQNPPTPPPPLTTGPNN
jgi:hypothetical protein